MFKMKQRLEESRFSKHFNRLTYLGLWDQPEVLKNTTSKALFLTFRFLGSAFFISAIVLEVVDLYFVVGNFRKVTYNCCTSLVVLGSAIKGILFYARRDHVNHLRLCLWKDSVKLDSPEDIAIQDLAYGQLKKMQNLLYMSLSIVIPIWLLCSYFSYLWGPRQLAFAGYFPMDDILNDSTYVPALTYQAFAAAYISAFIVEADLSMFSMVLQMEAYYQILCNNFQKLNNIYEDDAEERRLYLKGPQSKQMNLYLRKYSRQAVKSLVIRQQEIIKYAKHFEYIYYPSMLLQIIAGALLVIMNGVELSMFFKEMSAKLFFQSGYVIVIMTDIFLICYHLSRLSTESVAVANAAYSTSWYKMDPDVRRTLSMVIIRSQKPVKITAGKLFYIDLTTYLHMMRNVYSWLMLFRQVGSK